MYVCQNCKKVVDFPSPDGSVDRVCPWCLKDPKFGPATRIVRLVGIGFSVLVLVVVVALIVLKPAV